MFVTRVLSRKKIFGLYTLSVCFLSDSVMDVRGRGSLLLKFRNILNIISLQLSSQEL